MVEHQDTLYVFGGELSFCNDQETPLWMYDIKVKDILQCFQGLCKPKIDKKQSQKQSRIFKKQRKIQRKMKVFIKNMEKSFP